MHRLPPLKALRAFEAGARHLSFTRAANELSVTQTAISHQVRHLEEWLGHKLFDRRARGLELTDTGRTLYPVVSDAFQRISATSDGIRAHPVRRALSVSVSPAFGSRWLAERLGRFWRDHPDIDLRVHHSVRVVDLERDRIDLAVRWGQGGWPGVEAEPLMRADVTPICAAALLRGEHPIRTPDDLRHHVLLHAVDYQEWTEWLAAAGVTGIDARRGPIIDDATSMLRAALQGDGVMIAVPSMYEDEFASGALVAPFGIQPDARITYYLVYREGALDDPNVAAFRAFIINEAATGELATKTGR